MQWFEQHFKLWWAEYQFLFLPRSALKIWVDGLADTVLNALKLLVLILDFCFGLFPLDFTVTSTGFWVVGLINSLSSLRRFFTTNFFPFLNLITTFPIRLDFWLSSVTNCSPTSFDWPNKLLPSRLSCFFRLLIFAILSRSISEYYN